MSSVDPRRWKLQRILGIPLLLALVMAAISGSAQAAAKPGQEATTKAFAAAAQAEPELELGTVRPAAIPGAVLAGARAATFGARQLARTRAFRQQVAEVTRNAGVFRQLAGAFGFRADALASSTGVPDDVERIFDA